MTNDELNELFGKQFVHFQRDAFGLGCLQRYIVRGEIERFKRWQ